MTPGLARALAALLHEHANLRTARFAVHDAQHLRVGHERGAGEHFTAFLLQHQHLIDADFRAGLCLDPVDGDDLARDDLHLAAAALNDCEHARTLRPTTKTGLSRS